jgi:hypothetical protein
MPRMKKFALIITMLAAGGMTSGCIGLPSLNNMFYPVNDNKPDYARGSNDNPSAQGRAPLDVPPELRDQVSVPMPDQVAVDAARGGKMSEEEKQAIAGNAVSLDTHVYDRSTAVVFSAVVDAMTSLNLPVESVDSPSGTITTTWIRQQSGGNSYISAAMNVFGVGPTVTRYRYIVRIFRMQDGKTLMQVRTLGQQYSNNHWAFKPLKQKVVNELFSAVDERLAASQGKPETSPVVPTSGSATIPAPTSPAAKP